MQDALNSHIQLNEMDKKQSYKYLGEARKIGIESLDPCIGVGFVLKNGDDLKEFETAFAGG